MITKSALVDRISAAADEGLTELSPELLQEVFGGAPGDCVSFHDKTIDDKGNFTDVFQDGCAVPVDTIV